MIDVVMPFDYLCVYSGPVQRVKADLAEHFDLASRYAFKLANIYLLQGIEQPH